MTLPSSSAVMRIFSARPKPGSENAFAHLLVTESVRLVSGRSGFLGWIAAEPEGGGDYLFATLWRDESAVRAFAGKHWHESVLPDGYADLLESHSVRHVAVLGSSVLSL